MTDTTHHDSSAYLPPPAHPAIPEQGNSNMPPSQQGYVPTTQHSQAAFQEQGLQYQPAHQSLDVPPPPPPRPQSRPQAVTGLSGDIPTSGYAPPPKRFSTTSEYHDGLSDAALYTRDPHRLTAYLVPFPKPDIHKGFCHAGDAKDIPTRFLIYTPPAPPLSMPAEGEKEGKAHKLQRKWQQEVREAKTNDAPLKSWKGVKGRVTKGIDTAMGWTTTSSIDFLNRVPGAKAATQANTTSETGQVTAEDNKRTVGLEEMALIYPDTFPGTPEEMRVEFVNTMLRNKTKAERDAILATGLLPVAFAVDILVMLVWPFGGLAEIDGVWAAANIRGAKTARSVTKRLDSTSPTGQAADDHDSKLRLTFVPSSRVNVLGHYLAGECHKVDSKYFPADGIPHPTETEALDAIGWHPSQTGGETKNWEDEQWETREVKDDIRSTMHKGAKEWGKWCKNFEKDPEKALKK